MTAREGLFDTIKAFQVSNLWDDLCFIFVLIIQTEQYKRVK